MRALRKTGLVFAVLMLVCAASVRAGQPVNINSLPAGTRFCPAPGADNSEFMRSYFSIDARTGQMTRHDPDSGPVGVAPEPQAREEVLFVSPPISVENVYVPPPGGSAVPPRIRATGVYRQPPPQARAVPMNVQPRVLPQPQFQSRAQAYAPPYPQQPQRPLQPYPQHSQMR